jgi:2-polyprenyl-6-methoxyphenol hydroxylase-like FAD-dependent oxidoreductase
LTDIQQLPDKVVLTFADGEVAEANALFGADGIKGVVREHVLNPLYPSQMSQFKQTLIAKLEPNHTVGYHPPEYASSHINQMRHGHCGCL